MKSLIPRRTALLLFAFLSAAFAEDGARYLVVTCDNFYPIIQPLVQWKSQKGMQAKVVRLSETGSQPSQIQSYIRNAWNTWPVRPEYVLLVGAPSLLPPYADYPGDGTDDGYGDMTGDYEVEIPVGRFFASTASECSTLVLKTLTYEKTPFASGDSTWMRKGTTIVREDAPPDAYYQPDSRYVRGLWWTAGFVTTESLLSSSGHNSANVRNAINEGRGFVTHRGQCVSNWWPPFDQVQPNTLSNGAKLPIVVSGSCESVTLYPGRTMLADQFVRAGTPQVPRGAVAYFGTTAVGSGVSLQRGTVYKGFFTAIFDEGWYKLGDACKRGKFYLDSLLPGSQYYYQEWNLLGDPELPIWTDKPQALAVTFDSEIPVGPIAFPLHVVRSGSPLAGALACVTMDSTVYARGLTDANGNVTLNFTSTNIGNLTITVTARNALPYEGSARVAAGNTPYVVLRRCVIDDSQGNGDGRANPGEMIRLSAWLFNSGDSMAVGVTAGLAATDSFVSIGDSLKSFGNIGAHDSVLSSDAYLVRMAPTCTTAQSVGLALHIRDSHGHAWQGATALVVSAADIRYEARVINDAPPGGNGNGQLDPRESVKLIVNLRNQGTDPLLGVAATLRCASSHVSITDSTGYYGEIPVGLSASNGADPFAFATSPNLPSAPIVFTLVIHGDGGTYSYSHTRQFTLTPSANSGPIGPDPYGYYCYDDTDTLTGRAPAYSWLELAPPGPGQLISGLTDADAGLDTLRLPFRFRFYGSYFDTLTVASNGFAAFGATYYRGATNSHIPCADSAQYRNLLPMWDDMNPDQNNGGHGDIYQYYDAANHRWIEEFYQVSHYWSQSTQETFQLILLDPAYYPTPSGDGDVLFVYNSVGDPTYATVGIQDPTWTRAVQYECNGAYDPNAAQIVNRRVLRFTTLPPMVSTREWLTLNGIMLDDSTLGNGNHIAEPGERIRLATSLANLGEDAATAVQAILRNSDGNVAVSESAASFGDISAHGRADNAGSPFGFQVASQPSDSLAQFALALTTQLSSSVLYFTISLGGVTGLADVSTQSVRRYELVCRPNPSHGLARISLALPVAAKVNLAIYDVGGRLVSNLMNRGLGAGIYELDWPGRDASGHAIADGVYFLRLATDGGQRLTRKLEFAR